MDRIKSLELEGFIGIETYKSKTDGIGGRIRQVPEDFIVEEITPEGRVLEVEKFNRKVDDKIPGEYLQFTLQKNNWDTMLAIKEVSKRLGISYKRFGFAGTKDKRALTMQRISVRGVSAKNLEKVNIKDIAIGDLEYRDEGISLGDLWGNRFTIEIRDLELAKDVIEDRVKAITTELSSGFPNFVGVQRFGAVRPITHLVGKEILKRDFKNAVMIYLTKEFEGENEETRNARRIIKETQDFKEGLKILPRHLSYESAMLNHLVKKPADFIGALRKLPKKLRLMFVHAYQGFVFNTALSRYIRQEMVVEKLPMVGYETGMDEITKKILEDEGIKQEDFRLLEMPELSSKGIYRDCFLEVRDFGILSIGKDELNARKNKITLRFSLSKGNYATTILREFMKNDYWS